MSYKIAAVENAVAVMEAVADNPRVGVTRLAELTGSTKSQAFRLLYTLEKCGYVAKDPDTAGYTLGYRALLLGELAKQQTDLIREARPLMEELTAQTRETSHLVVREGVQSVCVAIVEGPQPLRLYAQIGRHGPLHAGGGSKVLLAFAPKEVQERVLSSELERHTPTTLTTRAELEELLGQIRRDGYHIAVADLDDGAFSVAAPIRDHTGAVIASITVAGAEFRLTPETRERHIESVLRASARISERLGGRGR